MVERRGLCLGKQQQRQTTAKTNNHAWQTHTSMHKYIFSMVVIDDNFG